ncbi:Threonine aldolase, partial [Lunasporangiospora selenospora]
SNQLAHRVHLCNPPQSALVDIRSHVFNYEAGGISFHSQAAVYPVMPANGSYLTVEDVASRLVMDVDVHYAPTRIVSLENTLNGTIMPLEEIIRIRELTQEHDIKLHLDGARLWHASISTGISMKEYCSYFDTISLCLSKGIGAPIGSILVGSEVAIKKARHFRLLFGGGWRQAGILAEAALWGIKNNWPTMEETHRRAKWLERVFLQIGCQITNPVDTNMIWVDTTEAGFTVEELMTELAKEGIKISGSGCAMRVVLHYQITDEAVEKFIEVLRKMACTPRMKVSVDLTTAAMKEQPGSIYEDEEPELTSGSLTLAPSQRRTRHSTTGSAASAGSGAGKDKTGTPSEGAHKKEFIDGMATISIVDDFEEPFQPRPRHVRRNISNATSTTAKSQERPRSAYDPDLSRAAQLREKEWRAARVSGASPRQRQILDEDDAPHSPMPHTLRSTKSLDLQEAEVRAFASGHLDRSATDTSGG